MDIFNLKSNDVKDFKRFMDLKAPAFGGPAETEPFDKSKRKSLKNWTKTAKRDSNFENGGKNHNYDGYFCLSDSNGNLSQYFIFISNLTNEVFLQESNQNKIINDHQKLVNAVLS